MRVVTAIDSLKGSLSSMEAGSAAREGILRVFPGAKVNVRPLADGGEGTVEALAGGMDGKIQRVTVTGPLGNPVTCEYGIIEDTKTAIVEMSGAAGITLLTPGERNPLHTTTYGVGEVIRDAIEKGCRRFIVGIGGSEGLSELVSVTADHVVPGLEECQFRVACDVTNVLCGEQGCSAVYGPQKGATPSMIVQMDEWLERYASLAQKSFPKADPMQPGTGAAGGLGFAFLTFTNAVLESGIKIVLEETGLEDYIKAADLVITGEGRLDGQTAMGKAPVGVAELAKKHGKPVIAFAGSVTRDAIACNGKGIDAFFPILRGVCTLDEAMKPLNARENMADTAEQVFRLLKAGTALSFH